MEVVAFIIRPLFCLLFSISAATAPHLSPVIPFGHSLGDIYSSEEPAKLLHASFPSEADTLAYVDTLKHSNFSQWRSLEEVAKRAGGGSCSGAVNTSVLTALYLLGLFNLCAASPASCCIPPPTDRRRRRSFVSDSTDNPELPRLLDKLQLNLTSLSLEHFRDLPHVSTADGGKIPVHISVVEQVRKLWDSNPRLLSNVPCSTATEAVRSSFISLSGVASGIILAYSIAQLNQCYPDHNQKGNFQNIWFFPIPRQSRIPSQQKVRSLPPEMPVKGEDDPDDGCERSSVRMENGECVKVFSSEFCPYMNWILLNRETGKGECVPRLCSNGKVFVEFDQMCHDVNEPGYCPRGQRLFLTAWGEAVCDCIDGTFYGPDGKCHRLYEQAYCYKGTVLQFHKPSKTLVCKADSCQHLNSHLLHEDLPYAKDDEGICYQFSSTGPCEIDHRFGFDIEELKPTCVSLEQAGIFRPPKSYQYSHMSFPSSNNASVPHYEVSYVIVNGSTWELMMRTVGRDKRDVRNTEKTVIPFLDTRDFPTNMDEILPGLEEIGLIVGEVQSQSDSVKKDTFKANKNTSKSAENESLLTEEIISEKDRNKQYETTSLMKGERSQRRDKVIRNKNKMDYDKEMKHKIEFNSKRNIHNKKGTNDKRKSKNKSKKKQRKEKRLRKGTLKQNRPNNSTNKIISLDNGSENMNETLSAKRDEHSIKNSHLTHANPPVTSEAYDTKRDDRDGSTLDTNMNVVIDFHNIKTDSRDSNITIIDAEDYNISSISAANNDQRPAVENVNKTVEKLKENLNINFSSIEETQGASELQFRVVENKNIDNLDLQIYNENSFNNTLGVSNNSNVNKVTTGLAFDHEKENNPQNDTAEKLLVEPLFDNNKTSLDNNKIGHLENNVSNSRIIASVPLSGKTINADTNTVLKHLPTNSSDFQHINLNGSLNESDTNLSQVDNTATIKISVLREVDIWSNMEGQPDGKEGEQRSESSLVTKNESINYGNNSNNTTSNQRQRKILSDLMNNGSLISPSLANQAVVNYSDYSKAADTKLQYNKDLDSNIKGNASHSLNESLEFSTTAISTANETNEIIGEENSKTGLQNKTSENNSLSNDIILIPIKHHFNNSSLTTSNVDSTEFTKYCSKSDTNILHSIINKIEKSFNSNGKNTFDHEVNSTIPTIKNESISLIPNSEESNPKHENLNQKLNNTAGLKLYFNEPASSIGGSTKLEENEVKLLVDKRLEQISQESKTEITLYERDLHKVEGIIKVQQIDLKPSKLTPSKLSKQKSDTSSAKIQTDKQRKPLSGKRKMRKGKKGRKYKKTEKRKENEVQIIPDQVNEKTQVNNLEKNSVSISGNSSLNKGEGLAVTGFFGEDSLPDYLRNRDRRQAGSKRGGKTSPGIINAPLLNQCRPGAKRDYNGHCRPKVIPEYDVPAPRKAKDRLSQPSLPRIKCEGSSRLDARGVCRTTFSGLG